MLVLTMPIEFTVGSTADVEINSERKHVIWRDSTTLVIEPDDVRSVRLVTDAQETGLRTLLCSDAKLTA